MQGKLLTTKFPTLVPFDYREKPTNLIVFMVGGATYQEAKEISTTYNEVADKVILGGTYIHNSRSFLAEVSQIKNLQKNNQAAAQKSSFEIQWNLPHELFFRQITTNIF